MVNYRFYIVDHYEHITQVHVAECDNPEAIERTARVLLAENVTSLAVEAWDRGRRICRVERPAVNNVASPA